jgi:hypothetical protein
MNWNIKRFDKNLCYILIRNFYGDKTTARSGVKLINHIDEGFFILTELNASVSAAEAYCLHPIVQSDTAAVHNLDLLRDVPGHVAFLAAEYRHAANAFLSDRIVLGVPSKITLSKFQDVNDMLKADKIQNRKDFELYHKGKHPRTKELEQYFSEWLAVLGVSEEQYQGIVEKMKEFFK